MAVINGPSWKNAYNAMLNAQLSKMKMNKKRNKVWSLLLKKELPAEWAENNKVQKDQRDFVVT